MNTQKLPGKLGEARIFCENIFTKVSRTFAINVKRLPKSLQFEVLIAYLLCRIADTVEDDPRFTPQKKARLLKNFVSFLTSDHWREQIPAFIKECKNMTGTAHEEILMQHSHYVIECFRNCSPQAQKSMTPWITELSMGMRQYALRKTEQADNVTFLHSIEDLEKYCYYVAGTVGQLLTGLFCHHYSSIHESLQKKLESKAESFGIGLQLTNIIKDSVVDYQRGWCYLPQDLLVKWNLTGEAFLEPSNRVDAQRLMAKIIQKARKHLRDGMEYTLLLPKRAMKLRTFCFLPLFMAIKTLSKTVNNDQLFDHNNPVKISRNEVVEIVRYTYFNCWSNKRMKNWYDKVDIQVETQLTK